MVSFTLNRYILKLSMLTRNPYHVILMLYLFQHLTTSERTVGSSMQAESFDIWCTIESTSMLRISFLEQVLLHVGPFNFQRVYLSSACLQELPIPCCSNALLTLAFNKISGRRGKWDASWPIKYLMGGMIYFSCRAYWR